MKNRLYLLGILSVMLIASCTKSDDDLVNGTNASWSVDSTINSSGEYSISLGDQIVFTDSSQNTLSHMWIIEDGCSFASTSGNESSNSIETVKFDEVGLYKVTLYNTYEDDVSDAMNSIVAYYDGDVWVVEQDFWVNVYGDLDATLLIASVSSGGDVQVVASFEAGYEIPSDTNQWSQVTIATGDRIVFIDESDNGADAWSISYGDQIALGSNYSVDILFSEIATYSDFEYEVSRATPYSQIVKAIPIIVEVVEGITIEPEVPESEKTLFSSAELSLYGFDNVYSTNYWTANTAGLYYTLVTEPIAAGTGSLRFYHEDDLTNDDAVVAYMINGSATDQYVFTSTGKFRLTHKVYVTDNGVDLTDQTYLVDLKGGVTGAIVWSNYVDEETDQSLDYTIPETRGEWVDVERIISIESGDMFNDKFVIRITMPEGTPGETEVYFDDFNLYQVL